MALSGYSGNAQTKYTLVGSDALTEVITAAIAASGANLTYRNTGSAQGERDLFGLAGYQVGYDVREGIAPMSRNFTQEVLSAYPSSAPTDLNIVALDAGVLVVTHINGFCENISVPLADPTNPALGVVNSDLSIILSGYRGPGIKSQATTSDCAHPERLAALARLVSCQGVNRIDHIYRHDDNSGTEELFRERLQFERWCNGQSNGNVTSASGSNVWNSDLDPIRGPCTTVNGDTTKAPSRCTYYPLNYPPPGQTCRDGDVLAANDPQNPYHVALPCTEGLIVALSENDPGAKDISLSIGRRVAADLNGYTMGVTSVAAVKRIANQATVAPTISTVTYEDWNVRTGTYMLGRPLFLQRRQDALSSGWTDAGRNAEEMKLFNWATNRCNIKAIVEAASFLAPLANCTDACTDPLNVTCLTAEPGVSLPPQNIGAESTLCDGYHPCVANGQACNGGYCPAIPPLQTGFACILAAKCYASGSATCGSDPSGVNLICKSQ